MTIIDIISGSESTWIEWTEPALAAPSASRIDPFRIKFTKLIDPESINPDVVKLFDGNGEEVESAFSPISVLNDYDPVSKIVELRLAAQLLPEEQYTLLIDGLYDAAGDSQDLPHIVTFVTNDASDPFVLDVTAPSVIAVVDRTISNADLVSNFTGHAFYMNPTDGSYNVAGSTEVIQVTIAPALTSELMDLANVVVRRRLVSVSELPFETLATSFEVIDASHIEITLPSSGSNFVEPGYEYEVTIQIGTESNIMYFMGILSPMFTTVQSVLIQAPSLRSYEAAKYIYLSSAFAATIDTSLGSGAPGASVTKAAEDYALYETLSMMTRSEGISKYQLADLTISYSGDMVARWKKYADSALARIVRIGPKALVKGSGNVRPYAARDWDAAIGGTTKLRSGSV